MPSAEFEMPMRKSAEAVAAVLVAFDVFVGRSKRRYQDGERQEFQVAVADDLFSEEVEGGQHSAEFAI